MAGVMLQDGCLFYSSDRAFIPCSDVLATTRSLEVNFNGWLVRLVLYALSVMSGRDGGGLCLCRYVVGASHLRCENQALRSNEILGRSRGSGDESIPETDQTPCGALWA